MSAQPPLEQHVVETGVLLGPDGLARCRWAGSAPEYLAYHDAEWGAPVHAEQVLYERLTLEAFQSGLSWITILRKREAFSAAFAGFDPDVVAGYGAAQRERLMADAGIVRNRRKIEAAIGNAKAVLAMRADGGLDALFWSYAPAPRPRPTRPADVPASTPESVALAKALKAYGMVHIGPTTTYAAMQACGLVDDHLAGCQFGRR